MFFKRFLRKITLALSLLSVMSAVQATEGDKPEEIILGITTFLSGSASVFGVPGKVAAEIYLEELNAGGGIHGVPVRPIFIDEGKGASGMLSDYRRVVQAEKADLMMAAISSGNCMALGPVAEDLKVVNIMWDCGTEKALEGLDYKYVVRSQANAVTEMVASVLYLLKVYPDFKTIAVVNQDYAWGHDSWEIFSTVLKQMKPDVEVVAEFFPKFGAPDYSSEISRLQALKPDVVFSSSWGGDLDTFTTQASQRGLFRNSKFFLALAESSLERLGSKLPEGVLVGARGDHYFLHPEYVNDPKHSDFVSKYLKETGSQPIYPVYHMVQAMEAMVGAYDKAIVANDGNWPSKEQLADALHGLTFRGLTSEVTIRPKDGQGLEDQLFGVTTSSDEYDIRILKDIMIVPADLVTTPVGETTPEWLKTLDAGLLDDVDFYREGSGGTQ